MSSQERIDVSNAVSAAKDYFDKEFGPGYSIHKEVAKTACDQVMQEFIKQEFCNG